MVLLEKKYGLDQDKEKGSMPASDLCQIEEGNMLEVDKEWPWECQPMLGL